MEQARRVDAVRFCRSLLPDSGKESGDRRSERKDARAVELTPDMEEASEASGPYERLVNKERMALIHRLINELPEKQRLIMQLRDMEGKSYKEIAVVLSLTEEQVKVNLFRARQKVKQRFIDIEGYGL